MVGLVWCWAALAAEVGELDGWRRPPDPIPALLDAARPPAASLAPSGGWIAFFARPALPALAELAAPEVALAGLRIDPQTDGPAEPTRYPAGWLRARDASGMGTPIGLPADRAITGWSWAPDDTAVALTALGPAGYELWVATTADPGHPTRVVGDLHAVTGAPCAWLPAGAGFVCKQRLGAPAPVAPAVPTGPRVEENLGEKRPSRTLPDLLRTAAARALFAHHTRSRLVRVAPDGAVTPLLEGEIARFSVSPDGRYVLVDDLEPPWSSEVGWDAFARARSVLAVDTGAVTPLGVLPLADRVSTRFDAVRPGPREVGWRGDRPASLFVLSALDGGDPDAPADRRDRLAVWDAPFTGEPTPIHDAAWRIQGVWWGDDALALVETARWSDRRTQLWRVAPGDPARPAERLVDRSSQDAYADPGRPLLTRAPTGGMVLRRAPDGALWFAGAGASPDGLRPFLDRVRLTPTGLVADRRWCADAAAYESLVDLLDDAGRRFVTWRESPTTPPQLVQHDGGRARPLTAFADWAPAFAAVRKSLQTYPRADGVSLTATVYFPPGYDPARDGPRPALFWVYPAEFKRKQDAGQVTTSASTFTRPSGASPLYALLQGWVVVDNPTLPIVGEGDAQPNDTYVAQLQAGAQAHVAALASAGWIDPARVVVGGHSYGAFTTANLLAHTDLFRAGIARSGAYNRTLTPFGFQGEERTFWEATDTYVAMSPFAVADRINEPLLLIHGGDDKNTGTWPVQSQRLYDALKGLGATVRYVELPFEDHGYRARESVGQTLAEMLDWAARWTAPAETGGEPR